VASLVLGYAQPGGLADIEAAKPELVLLLGADEMPADRLKGAYKVYIGHHGDNGAKQADLVLPGAAYAEKHGTYVNTEGRVQRGEKAAFPPGEAREDWAILRALSDVAGKRLPYDDVEALRRAIVAEVPHFGARDVLPPSIGAEASVWDAIGAAGPIDATRPLTSPIADFYLTNPIARASETMAECSRLYVQRTPMAAE
jgi:NADH-quinone oxidoreductase subunit G